jgi:cyclophilin family peptidyl-prolyl cis-trans isomerase
MKSMLVGCLAVGVLVATSAAADKKAGTVVVIETSMGNIKVELNEEKAPITAKNFLGYVDDKFYDGTTFHRVIPKFVIQGGGILPGLKEKPTKPAIKNEAANGLSNVRGTIAMARDDAPDTATAQFYINVADNKKLDRTAKKPGYCVFGKVIDGLDVVDKIVAVPRETRVPKEFENVPVKDILIKSIRREAK